jgi:hypothetical protein
MSRTIVGAAMLVIVESIRSSTSASSTMARIRRSGVVSRVGSAVGGDWAALLGSGVVASAFAPSPGPAPWLIVVIAWLAFWGKAWFWGCHNGGAADRRPCVEALTG